MHFWKSRRKGEHAKVKVVTSSQSVQATSTVQDSVLNSNSREAFYEEVMEQTEANSGGVFECFNKTSNLVEKTNPSNHQQCQHKETHEPSAAIEFSKAIPKLFPQKNGKGVPTVVVFNGNKLTSILTPMTSSINIKSLQKCKSLTELVNVIGSQRTYTRAIVKSTGEPLYRDSSGMFYARKLIPRCDSPSDELDLNGPRVSESNICSAKNETSQERRVDYGGKHELATACIRKKNKNEKQVVIEKIIDINGKFLDNRYTCKCGQEFRTYRAFWKHDCDKEINICSCPDCDNQHTKKRILTIQFKDIEPEVDSQKAMIEIGLGINTEPDSHTATESTEEIKQMQTEVIGISTNDSIGVKHKIREGRRTKTVKAPKKVSPPQTMDACPKVVRVEHNADGTPVDYTCKICTFVAEHRRGLNQHMRVHFPEEYEKKRAEKREKNVNDAEHDKSEPSAQGQETVVENIAGINNLALSCRLCGMVFSKQIHLDEHVRSHTHKVEDYVEKESSLVDTVVERAVTVAPHTFTCEICSKTLDIVFRQIHIQTHFGDERFTCEICNENLYTREQYNLHMRAHKGDNPYICRVCRKKFCSLRELEQHVLSHNGSKRYACRFCDRWFKRPISKVEHERLHTGEKPFPCSFCGMKFRLKGTRELHVRIHTGLKPYCCEVCKKCFRSKYNLRAHVAIHSDERNFKCSICPKTFKTAVSLSSHKNHHTKPYKCPVCLRRFDSSYSERQHRKSHSAAKSTLKYKCTICGIMYARSFGLRDHMLTHNVVETGQSSELEYCGVKNNHVSESMEMVDDECTQTADFEFADVDDECMEAAEFLVVNSSEDCFQTPNYVLQVANEEATQGFVGDDSDEAYVETPETVVNLPNEDSDYPGSIYAVADDFTEAGGYLIAADVDESQQPVGLLVVETCEDSQYVLAVAEEDSAEVPQLELSDIYDECGLSGVVRSHNQDCNRSHIGLSNCTALVSVNVEENECVPPVPVNFEEVKTEVDIDHLDFS
ncbi:hypothetical protein PR048_032693 [Dryococelus australis]|uniref:C2H2-type domain-containing protein n=1 Tax=Dryococelus australis TaxID=614101 RepID=A0ABQ9G5W9_9NEOP|nr:hypothetical protein PR048_032693 [Dryococelus australis]